VKELIRMRAKLNITDKYQDTALDNATTTSEAIPILKASNVHSSVIT
jgi:predicted amino acid racemase